jgi:hypothetical protein
MVLICLGIPIINVKLTTIAEIRVDWMAHPFLYIYISYLKREMILPQL